MIDLEGNTLDHYELRKLVGKGGMADVYLGYDPHFDRDVAIKVFKREDEDLLRRFIREAQLMASLSNPHLMPIYDAGVVRLNDLPCYFIVMPFMEGGTLRARIRRSPLSFREICYCLSSIADALDYMHEQGIIHRDIKSSNVLLDAEGRCYLSDFGIARTMTDATQMTSTGNVLGTVDYIAPELFEPNRRADARSDLYSLGVLLFEMVTRKLPFGAENQLAVIAMHIGKSPPSPRAFVPTLPPQIERVLLKALEKRPELRYSSASALAEAFCRSSRQNGGERAGYPLRERVMAAPSYVEAEREEAPERVSSRPQRRAAAQSHPAGNYRSRPPRGQRNELASASRTRTRIVTVLALLALLAVIGPAVYAVLNYSSHANTIPLPSTPTTASQAGTVQTTSPSSPTPDLTATAQDATATAQVVAATATQQAKDATVTAIAGATATVQAQASATAGVIQTATTGQATYSDPLNNPNRSATQAAQWDQNSNCVFKSDGYHALVGTGLLNAGLLHGCLAAGRQYQNFALTVDIKILSGHSGGVFFRVSTKTLGAYAGYLFEVDSQGDYKISRSDDFSSGSGNQILQDWIATSALKTGNAATNTLQVIARSNTLLFYINGVFLAPAIQDTTFTSGDIAFLATTVNNGSNADILYTNVHIYSL